jgi:hypothetical protein
MDGWTLLHQADGMDGNGCTDLHFHPFHPFEKVRGVDRHTGEDSEPGDDSG